MFIDEITIHVKAGDGGNGCSSFRREKYVPKGGPNGGDGGRGGSVLFVASPRIRTLTNLRYQSFYKAEKGLAGQGSNKTGKSGEDLIIPVPVGTIVKTQTGGIIDDLTQKGQTFLVAKGGRGGRGNARFATSTNRAPRFAQKGSPGEEKYLALELKLLADVGIIGLPNAGKSTLISHISSAKPRIADYPFTTLQPNLGMVTTNFESFCVADIPGLIQGAHQGTGLGDRFLRHIERSKIIVHLIDVSLQTLTDPVNAYHTVLNEMKLYNPNLLKKAQLIVANKIDTLDKDKINNLEALCQEMDQPLIKISAVTGENIKPFINRLKSMLDNLDHEESFSQNRND